MTRPKTKWRPGVGAWAMGAILAFIVSGMIADDLAGNRVAWVIAAQVIGFMGFGIRTLRMFLRSVTATPDVLLVRTGRKVRLLPWDELTGAAAVNGGNLTIIGTGPGEGAVIEYAGIVAPKRIAAQIAEVITNPALRPAS